MASLTTMAMENLLTDAQRVEWGWRVPFLFAFPIGIPVLMLQRHMEESAEFRSLADPKASKMSAVSGSRLADIRAEEEAIRVGNSEVPASPPTTAGLVSHVLSTQRTTCQICIGMVAMQASMHYGMISYFKDLLVNEDILPVRQAGEVASIALVAVLVTEIFVGVLIDVTSLAAVVRFAMPALLLSVWPLWVLLTVQDSLEVITVGALAAGVLYGLHVAFVCLSVSVFPTAVRATALGLAYNVGQLLFGAPAPFVSNFLLDTLEDTSLKAWQVHSIAPSIWIYVSLACTCAALALAYRVNGAALASE